MDIREVIGKMNSLKEFNQNKIYAVNSFTLTLQALYRNKIVKEILNVEVDDNIILTIYFEDITLKIKSMEEGGFKIVELINKTQRDFSNEMKTSYSLYQLIKPYGKDL